MNSLKSDVVTLSRENNKLNSEKDILKKKVKDQSEQLFELEQLQRANLKEHVKLRNTCKNIEELKRQNKELKAEK